MKYEERTLEWVENIVDKAIEDYNNKYNENIPSRNFPIQINGRLTRTLGRFSFYISKGIVLPKHIEISKLFLLNADIDNVIDTILHETAHYIATKKYKVNCGHDSRWKNIARKINAKPDATKELKSMEAPKRYAVICSTHGVVGWLTRLTKHKMSSIFSNNLSCKLCESSNMFSRDIYIYDTKEHKFIGESIDLDGMELGFLQEIVR